MPTEDWNKVISEEGVIDAAYVRKLFKKYKIDSNDIMSSLKQTSIVYRLSDALKYLQNGKFNYFKTKKLDGVPIKDLNCILMKQNLVRKRFLHDH